jgi:predicted AlkP superfamily phosphohydrolase/phosphomutase
MSRDCRRIKAQESGVFTTEEFWRRRASRGRSSVISYVLDHFEVGCSSISQRGPNEPVMWESADPGHPRYDPEIDPTYKGVIEEVYVGLEIVGQALERLTADDTLVVMSDHGFASWRRSFHLNAWLKEKGYLVVKDPGMEDDPGLFVNVDWAHTRAYGVGLNGLYINLKGREKNGSCRGEPQALMDEIAMALLAEVDPRPAVRW